MTVFSRNTAANLSSSSGSAASAGAGHPVNPAPVHFLIGDEVRFQSNGKYSHEQTGRVVGRSFGATSVDVELTDGERINGVMGAELIERGLS